MATATQIETVLLDAELTGIVTTQGQCVNGRGGLLARRRFQNGQLLDLGGKWFGRWREDQIEGGKVVRRRVQEYLGSRKDYPTKHLAERALRDRLAVINHVNYRPRPTATFTEFAASWEASVLNQFGASTAINYRVHVRKHLVPFFGKYAMKDVTPEMVQRYVSTAKSSPKTIRNICITLQSMWRSARKWGYVTHDPLDGVVLAKAKRVQRYFFSAEEVRSIIARSSEPYRTFYGLAAETGLRAGELCGITLDSLDLDRKLLFVRQSAWRGKLGDPKTEASIRTVELSLQACEHVARFLDRWHPNERRLLFATRNGTPWDANLLLKRKFKTLLNELGIRVPKGNGFHAFRHANATMMDRFGTPLKIREERLGHSDSRITQAIYTHVASEDSRRVAAQLGDAVWGILDANGRENRNGSEGSTSKPFRIN
jgi:integrase